MRTQIESGPAKAEPLSICVRSFAPYRNCVSFRNESKLSFRSAFLVVEHRRFEHKLKVARPKPSHFQFVFGASFPLSQLR